MISYDGDSSSSSDRKHPKQTLTSVTQALTGFTPSNRFERKLILGILFKHGKVPDGFCVPSPQLLTDEPDLSTFDIQKKT